MKRLLFLVLMLAGFGMIVPRANAAVGTFTILCSGENIEAQYDPQSPDATKKAMVLGACLNHIKAENKTGASLRAQERNNQTGQALSGGFDYTSNFCWCSSPSNPGSCTVSQLVGANNATECNAQCSAGGTVSRRFEATYKDYSGTTANNKCGNYCWCMEPTSAEGTETRCTLHRKTPRTVGNTSTQIPLTSNAECNALCPTINAGTRRGVAKHYETAYRDYSGSADCSTTNTPEATPEGTGGTAQTPSTPPPTIRLFNPMAGASTVVDIVNRFIKILMGLVGAGALLMFIYGGIKWMTAGGDAKNVSEAQTILKNSTLGLLLLIFAYSIVSTFFSVLT